MAQDSFASWEKLLNPDKLKQGLIQASIYLAAYEIFKGSTLDKLRSFFAHEWYRDDTTGEFKSEVSDEHKQKVMSLYPKDEFRACCLWFVNNGAIDQNDLNEITTIRSHRNSIAHGLPKYIGSIDHDVNSSALQSLVKIVRKIDLWWLREVEIPTSPDFDMEKYDDILWDEVISSNSMVLELMLGIFQGDDSHLRKLHTQFVETCKQRNSK